MEYCCIQKKIQNIPINDEQSFYNFLKSVVGSRKISYADRYCVIIKIIMLIKYSNIIVLRNFCIIAIIIL